VAVFEVLQCGDVSGSGSCNGTTNHTRHK